MTTTTETRSFSLQELDAAKEQYDELGFCVIDGIFSAEELNEIEQLFDRIRENGEVSFEGQKGQYADAVRFEDVDKTKKQVRVLHPHRKVAKVLDWYLHPNIAVALEKMLGKPALAAQTMYYYKPPGSKGQGMHQDNFYLLAQPATCIGAWTPIDDADEENGCLWVAPGSNQDGYICPDPDKHEEKWLSYGNSHITKFPRDRKPVPVPVKRGETMLFNGYLIHGSGPNRHPTRWRRTFIGHYCDEATESISKFYHPILNMQGETVSNVELHQGGGPCGDGWQGAAH